MIECSGFYAAWPKASPGLFDQRAASSQEALLLLGSSSDVTVNTAQLYLVNKDIDANELEAVKNYLLNPVDSRFKDITVGIAKQDFSESDKTIPRLDFFETYMVNPSVERQQHSDDPQQRELLRVCRIGRAHSLCILE